MGLKGGAEIEWEECDSIYSSDRHSLHGMREKIGAQRSEYSGNNSSA